jgi:UDP-2,3-diacylglucosamine pyrophosphatase LpxH
MPNNSDKNSIDVLIVSDIHLGSDLSRVEKLTDVLKKYKFKKLILNGDIFNGFNFKRLPSAHWSILSFIRKLSRQSEVIWIKGNHDGSVEALTSLLGVRVYNQYLWENGGKKYLAIHGHQFDRFLHKNIIISSSAIFIYNLIQKLSGQSEIINSWIKRRSKDWLRLKKEVADGAIRYGRLKKVNYIFCGHTHSSDYKEKNGIKYYNSGSWTESPSSYITIKGREIKINMIN